MSATVPCTPCCATTQVTNVPGREGDPGTNGTNGLNAYSTLTDAAFLTPGVGLSVTTTVSNTSWMVVGETIVIGQGVGSALPNPGPALFTITTINSLSSVTLTQLAWSGGVGGGTSISQGAVVSPSGVTPAFPTTTKGDLMVDDGANSPQPDVKRFPVSTKNGQSIFADSGTPGGIFGIKWGGGNQTLDSDTSSNATAAASTPATTVLTTYALAAGVLANNGDSIEFEAMFEIGGTAGNAKTVEVIFNATTVAIFGPVVQNAGTMVLKGRVIRTGAATEYFHFQAIATTGAGVGSAYATDGTAAINTAAGITIAGRGTNGAAATSDITQKYLFVRYCSV